MRVGSISKRDSWAKVPGAGCIPGRRDRVGGGPFVEVALYDAIDAAAFGPAQDDLHGLFAARAAPTASYRLRGDENPETHGDLIVWPDAVSWEAMGAELTAMSGFAPMFETMGPPRLFALFAPGFGDECSATTTLTGALPRLNCS